MIITTTGFYGTGSSAITDLMKEYDNIACISDYEIRLLHDPDGISDLEYNLIENPNRHNTSHAIKRFIYHMSIIDHVWFFKRYGKYFDGQFLPLVYKYVDSIVKTEYHSNWHFDVYTRGRLFFVLARTCSKICEILNRLFKTHLSCNDLIPRTEKAYLGTTNQSEFLAATRDFVDSLSAVVNKEKKEHVLFDQLVPPSNISRYERYVNNLKTIVVDRDPRDIYILEKKIWNGSIAPVDDIDEYISWYKWTRETGKRNSQNALKIRFEDLIFNYDKTISQIESYLGIDSAHHISPKRNFNPAISIKNTKLWQHFPEFSNEIAKIEDELKEYCFDYSAVSKSANNVNINEVF